MRGGSGSPCIEELVASKVPAQLGSRERDPPSLQRWRPDDTGKEACTQDANKAASGQTPRLVWPSNAHGYAGSRLTCSPGPRRKSV